MRNNKTPYWSDGDGIGRHLTGPELVHELKRLASDANEHHAKVDKKAISMLEHARLAGDALLQAERRTGGRKKWSDWRRRHFNGSKETSCHYMRIARHWNDPELVAARASGSNSINALINVLRSTNRNDTDDADSRKPAKRELREMETDLAREDLRKEFASRIKNLDGDELTVLSESLDSVVWPRIYNYLRTTVSQANEIDDDYYAAIREKRLARRKVIHALNDKRKTRTLRTSHPK